MQTISLLIKAQLHDWWRSKLLVILVPAICLLWIFCFINGYYYYSSASKHQQQVQQKSRTQWLEQGDKHPHIAAHFGNFAFKALSPLSVFDNGLTAYSGSYIYMEAHRQNDFLFSPAQSASSLVRLGTFNVSLLLQLIFPLFIIVLTFNSITAEKTKGTLQLIRSSGVSMPSLLWSKIWAAQLLLSGLLVALVAASVIFLTANNVLLSSQDVLKLLFFTIGYALYFFILIIAGVLVSAKSKSLTQSFIVLLSFWIVAGIVLPKLLNTVASAAYHLPSNTTFKSAVRQDILKGIDGHNTSDARAEKIKNDLLKKYKVDTTAKLPVNIEGVVMMEGEKYSSKVYNLHFDTLRNTLLNQQNLFSFSSVINPFWGIKLLSMGMCNADLYNEIRFREEAEKYRLLFVQTMNKDMALHSKEDEFATYKTGRSLFEKIPPFNYTPDTFSRVVKHYIIEIISLIILTAFLCFLVNRVSKKQFVS